MDLMIKFDNGSMGVHLEPFLEARSTAKIKKLVKLIQQSNTQEELDKMKEFIEHEVEQIEHKIREHNKYIIGYSEKVQFCQKQLDNALYNRNRFKKSTPTKISEGWEHYNQYVKKFRQELKEQKEQLRMRQSYLHEGVCLGEFLKKVLKILS